MNYIRAKILEIAASTDKGITYIQRNKSEKYQSYKELFLEAQRILHGIPYLAEFERELVHWMEEHEYESVQQMIGTMSQMNVADESAYERAQYMKVIQSFTPEKAIV